MNGMNLLGVYEKIFMVAAVGIMMLAASCTSDKEQLFDSAEVKTPIEFASSDNRTKGYNELNYERIRDLKFGLFAYTQDYYPYLENNGVEYVSSSGTTNHWRCDPAAYWPFQTPLNFFAYAPFCENVKKKDGSAEDPFVLFPAEDYVTGMPRLRYTPNTHVTDQYDFCVAVPCLDRTAADGAVHLVFHHTLTRIRFYVNLKGEKEPLYDYKVTDLIIRGIEGSKILTFKDNEQRPYEWDATDLSTPKTGEYHLTLADSELTTDTLKFVKNPPDEPTSVESCYTYVNSLLNGRLYLLPQTLTSDAEVEIAVSIFLKGNKEELVSMLPPFIVSLPESTVWEAEKTVGYLMTLDIENITETTIQAQSEDWVNSDNDHNQETLE